MDSSFIQAWINEVTTTQPDAITISGDPLPFDEMPKRKRTDEGSDDPDETPSRPGPQRRGVADQAVSSPRPVRFLKVCDLGKAVPSDAKSLFEALSIVAAKEQILPASLRDHADFQDARIRSFMWASTTNDETSASGEGEIARQEHVELRRIVDASILSFNRRRHKTGWNWSVHQPCLTHIARRIKFLEIEPFTWAQILPAFHPLFSSNEQASPTTSLSNASSASGQTQPSSQTSPVHTMVDYAVLLCPEAGLQSLIDEFLDKETYVTATINQTKYYTLRTWPAPIFVEAKISSGIEDTLRTWPAPIFVEAKISSGIEDDHVQLGMWVAAWHCRMRTVMTIGESTDKIITIPVIQIVAGVWTLLFAVDTGTEIVSPRSSVFFLLSGTNPGRLCLTPAFK